MTRKSVRLSLVSVVAVLSVFGLSQAPANAARVGHHHVAAKTGVWCC